MRASTETTSTPTSLYIDGPWLAASDGGTRDIRCPADDELVGTVSEATAEDTVSAIAAARRAFDRGDWPTRPAAERGDILIKVADLVTERADQFARAESLDTGKRLVESRIDMVDIAACFRYFGKLAAQDAGRLVDAGSSEVLSHNTVYHPAGTVRMGAVDDQHSPVDPHLRVKGVTGLRVADASVMPELTTVNPNITTMMIGERCADLIKQN